MTDRELVAALENGTLSHEVFGHSEHVRLAWLMVRRRGFEGAVEPFRTGLQGMAARAGRPEAYHETITLAFLAVVHERVASQPAAGDWAEFAAAHPDLLIWPNGVLSRYYSADRLGSDAARKTFVAPDLASLPSAEALGLAS